jgi:nicotinate-nucleotide--dimethylbenzimidazole phosphoribosyltransferase
MSSDVIARLESLLGRVIARRAVPRLVPAPPVAPPVVASSPAPRAITPEPPRAEARVEARRPEGPAAAPEVPPVVIEAAPEAPAPVVVEAPEAVVEAAPVVAAAPVAEAPKPVVIEPRVEEPVVEAPKTSLPLPGPAKISRADDRIAASFAAGASVSPGLGDDEADHVETLAFRVGRALPKTGQVPAPPLPVTTRDEPGERRSERFTASLPSAPIAAQVADAAARPAPASLRSLLQRSVALRPRG